MFLFSVVGVLCFVFFCYCCVCVCCVSFVFSFGFLSCVKCLSFCFMLLVVFVLLSSDIVLFVFVVFRLCFLRFS